MKNSCLNCSRFLLCLDKQKGPRHVCSKHLKLKDLKHIGELVDLPIVPEKQRKKDDAKLKALELALQEEEALELKGGADYANEFYSAMRRSYDPLTGVPSDVRLDFSDWALSKNIYDYVANQLGKGSKLPFARQFWILYHFTGEYCPHCTDPELEDIYNIETDDDVHEMAERAALLEHGVCPKCKRTKSEMVLKHELADYTDLVLVLGQRSGKSVLTGILCSYWYHRMLKVPKYSELCSGVQDFTPITGTLVALSFARAIKLLWNPVKELLTHGEWFSTYHAHLVDLGKRHGIEFLKFNSLLINYRHKNLELYPMGPLKRSLRGDTRVLGAVDELGWFPNKIDEDQDDNADEANEREFANADEVYAAIDNSLATIRIEVYNLYKKGINHVPTGVNLLTSSPASRRDKIWRLFMDSKESKVMLGMNLPTWEINPAYQRDHPFIVEAFRKNYEKAERDFGANPPELSATMYTREAVLPLFNGTQHHNIATVTVKIDKRPEQLSGELTKKVPRQSWPGTVLAIDGGQVNNSFTFALGHLQENIEPDRAKVAVHMAQQLGLSLDEVRAQLGPKALDVDKAPSVKLHVFTLGEIIPDGTRPINFLQVYQDVIHPLMKQCNTKFLFADRWNSLMLLESAQRDFPDCQALQLTLKPPDFKSFDKDFIDTHTLSLPSLEMEPDVIESITDYKKAFVNRPVSHLYLQFRTVVMQGSVPGKGDGFTDDLYRAVVLLATASRLSKVAEKIRLTPLLGLDTERRVHAVVGGRIGNMRRRSF